MAFDSTVMAAEVAELGRLLTGGRISKIYQPQADELALLIYAGGANHRLLLSANARYARIQLTKTEKRNPPAPPMFCMLLRKYVEGGRITAITQVGRERICRIQILVTDELGNPAEFVLIAEIMGKHSNIVLVGPQGRIVDAVRRVTEEVNRYRELLPGLPYVPPPPVNKLDPLALTPEALAALNPDPSESGWQFLLNAVDGLGPLLAKEAVARAGYPAEASLAGLDLLRLVAAVQDLAAPATFEPVLLYDPAGRLKEFHVLPQQHWAGRTESGFASISDCLDGYFGRREEEERVGSLRGSLGRVVRDEAARVAKKLALQKESLATAENAEELRIRGELITANLWQIQKGDAVAIVTNYYVPDQRAVTIELDPALEPAQNAQAYYRRYQKARSGRTTILEQVARSEAELAYLNQVEAMLLAAASLPDLEEVRRELQEEGYLGGADRKAGRGGRKEHKGRDRKGRGPAKPKESEERPAPPLTMRSSDGLEIWVGRNNRQNDYLTLKLAAPHDIWLHTKEIPGSHVILRVTPGQPVPERSLHEAAALAAYHSRGRDSSSVPVDYTLRKHVRKPTGARPGMVIYEHQKTLWVTPDPALNPILQRYLESR